MVKNATVSASFGVPFDTVMATLFETPHFEELAHKERGDKGISVTDWMAAGPEKRQRICFFTMVDREKGGLGDTVCMENQQLTQEKGLAVMVCKIQPDNPNLGNMFRLESDMRLCSDPNDSQRTLLEIKVEVECKTTVWGVTGMAENALLTVMEAAYRTWVTTADQSLAATPKSGVLNELLEAAVPGGGRAVTKQFRELRSRVVAGTEHIAQLFHEQQSSLKTSRNFKKSRHKEKDKESGEEKMIDLESQLVPASRSSCFRICSGRSTFGLLFVVLTLMLGYYWFTRGQAFQAGPS